MKKILSIFLSIILCTNIIYAETISENDMSMISETIDSSNEVNEEQSIDDSEIETENNTEIDSEQEEETETDPISESETENPIIIQTNTITELKEILFQDLFENNEKRLIVRSEKADFNTYSATSIISYKDLFILSFSTEEDTQKAYSQLKNEVSVEFDSILTIEKDKTGITEIPNDTILAVLDTAENKNENEIIINDNSSIKDDNGHGTEIIKNINNTTVKIMPFNISDKEGRTTYLAIIIALETAIENHANMFYIGVDLASLQDSVLLQKNDLNIIYPSETMIKTEITETEEFEEPEVIEEPEKPEKIEETTNEKIIIDTVPEPVIIQTEESQEPSISENTINNTQEKENKYNPFIEIKNNIENNSEDSIFDLLKKGNLVKATATNTEGYTVTVKYFSKDNKWWKTIPNLGISDSYTFIKPKETWTQHGKWENLNQNAGTRWSPGHKLAQWNLDDDHYFKMDATKKIFIYQYQWTPNDHTWSSSYTYETNNFIPYGLRYKKCVKPVNSTRCQEREEFYKHYKVCLKYSGTVIYCT